MSKITAEVFYWGEVDEFNNAVGWCYRLRGPGYGVNGTTYGVLNTREEAIECVRNCSKDLGIRIPITMADAPGTADIR